MKRSYIMKSGIIALAFAGAAFLSETALASPGSDIFDRANICISSTGTAKLQACYNTLSEAETELGKGRAIGVEKLKILQAQSTGWSQITTYFAGLGNYNGVCRAAASNKIANDRQAALLPTIGNVSGINEVGQAFRIQTEKMAILTAACEKQEGVLPPLTFEELRGFLG